MNITFGKTEMQTLNDLQALAKAHNMDITFGFGSDTSSDMDYNILEKNNVDNNIIEILKDESGLKVSNPSSTCDKVWFELFDNATKKIHSMTYLNCNLAFEIKEFDYYFYEQEFGYEKLKILEDFLNDSADDSNFYSYDYEPTTINGFGNKETVTDYRIYRSGMALKFFGDLVCDFLHEPRIDRVY